MNRLAWMSFGGVLALASAIAALSQASVFGLDDSPAATVIFAAVIGLLAFYVVSFGVPACLMTAQMAATNRRLAFLVREGDERAPYEPRALSDALAANCLADIAECYVDTLRSAGPGERWRGRDPADAFSAQSVIDAPLMTALYCRFAPIFIALALIALLMGCAGIIDDGLTSVTAMTELRATLVSSAAAFAAAAFTCLAQPLLTALCQSQLGRFALLLRLMFSVDDGSHELRQLVEGVSGLRREIAGLTGQEPASAGVSLRRLRAPAARRPRAGTEFKL